MILMRPKSIGKHIVTAFVVGSLLFSVMSGLGTPVLAAPSEPLTPQETTAALQSAYLYTLPLLLVNATRERAQMLGPSNSLIHASKLSDYTTKIVVTPNVDTLYSQIFLNFAKEEALVLVKPQSDRYYMIQAMNAYSDTRAILGTGADGQAANQYLFTRSDYKGKVPNGMQHIKIDTDMGWIIIRIGCASEADYPEIYSLQGQTKILPLDHYLSGEPYVPEAEVPAHDATFIPIRYVLGLSAQDYFDLANGLLISNPPKILDKAIMATLAQVNVGPGMSFDDAILGPDKTAGWLQIKTEANLAAVQEIFEFNTAMGVWSYFDKPIGEYRREYAYRAMVSLRGLGANPVDAAVYARTNIDETGNRLHGVNQYRIHFEPGQLPPVEDFGFWSVTVYGPDDFLMQTEYDKYAITDRSPYVLNADGSLDLWLAQTVPEGVDPANWLPVKATEFHLFLRVYVPLDDVAKGKWNAPTIEKIQ